MKHWQSRGSSSGVQAIRLMAALLALAIAPVIAQGSQTFSDQATYSFLQVDQLEYRTSDDTDALAWEAQGWVGGDYNRFWFKTDGEKVNGESVEEAELQLLYSHLIAPYWELQVGLRHDFEPDPARNYGVVGIEGLAPYWFEVNAAAFVSEDGEVSVRAEAEYELLLTQKLILQPLAEVNLAAQDEKERGVGSGFTNVELGLRLRYEIEREFAPYIGITWNRLLGQSADFARDEHEDVETFAVVAGLRLWY